MLGAEDLLDYARLRLAKLKLAEREEQEPRYDWYGPDCGCPADTRKADGSCRKHPRAREKQRPPEGEWDVWLIRAGRGFGKTRTGAEWIIDKAKNGPRNGQYALVGAVASDTRDIMIQGPSGILRSSAPWFMPTYEPSKRSLTWPNGVKALCYSSESPRDFRGPAFHGAWCDEFAKWSHLEECWDNLQFGMRQVSDELPDFAPQTCITTTPLPLPLIKELLKDPMTRTVNGSMYENAANLATSFIRRIKAKFEGTRFGRQEIYGEILEDAPGALWNAKLIDESRVRPEDCPEFVRIIVSVDPSVADPTKKGKTDRLDDSQLADCGIVCAAVGDNGHLYVLSDRTLKAHPHTWGNVAVGEYHNRHADALVAEVNNGGALVESLIRSIDENINYIEVHASRGKHTRAEPIASLYEQGKVHHVGVFPELEEEMCTWVPLSGMKSPNRIDALVWAGTELMLNGVPLEFGDHPAWPNDWRGD